MKTRAESAARYFGFRETSSRAILIGLLDETRRDETRRQVRATSERSEVDVAAIGRVRRMERRGSANSNRAAREIEIGTSGKLERYDSNDQHSASASETRTRRAVCARTSAFYTRPISAPLALASESAINSAHRADGMRPIFAASAVPHALPAAASRPDTPPGGRLARSLSHVK